MNHNPAWQEIRHQLRQPGGPPAAEGAADKNEIMRRIREIGPLEKPRGALVVFRAPTWSLALASAAAALLLLLGTRQLTHWTEEQTAEHFWQATMETELTAFM